MRMEGQDESQNVEDARGSSGFRPVHGIGLGTIALALIGGWIFGVNPLQLLGLMSGEGRPPRRRHLDGARSISSGASRR